MTAYWLRHIPPTTDVGATAGARSSTTTADAIVIGRSQGTVVVTLHGTFDLGQSAGLRRVLDDLIEGQGNLAILVDLRDLGRIDCSGLAVLRNASGQIAARGGKLRLGGPIGVVFDSLALAGLATLIDRPIEDERHPWPPDRPGRSTRLQASKNSHPAGAAAIRPGRPAG